jgi:sugar (pentulose or hexulose) kinase
MVCYANGSRTREAVRDGKYGTAGSASRMPSTWEEFEAAVQSVPVGCEPRKVGIFNELAEITPRRASSPHANIYEPETLKKVSAVSWAELCRLSIESRALNIALHVQQLGEDFVARRILLAGGGSASTVFPQIMADALNAPVYAAGGATAGAAEGAARRARHGVQCRDAGCFKPFEKGAGVAQLDASELLAKPVPENVTVYRKLRCAMETIFNRSEDGGQV